MAKLRRRFGLGGADISSLCGLNQYKPPRQLYLEKIGEFPEDDVDSARMRWGRRMELPIIQEFGFRTGRKVWRAKHALRHPTLRWQRGNIDSWQQRDGHDGIVEAKTADWTQRSIWNAGGVPIPYYLQVQWYLYISNTMFGSVVVAFGFREKDFLYFDVERDNQTISTITRLAHQFWTCIKQRQPPDWTYDESGLRLIEALHPVAATPKKSITLDSVEAVAKAKRLLALRATIKDREEQQLELETWFKVQMSDATEAIVPGVANFKWPNVETARFNQRQFKQDHPDIANQYTRSEVSRRFSVTPFNPGDIEDIQDEAPELIVTSGVRQIQLD